MPSKMALVIADLAETYLGRPLSLDEVHKCEELNINFYSGAILGYINGLKRKGAPKDFDFVYIPIMSGVIPGAYRRRDIIRIKGRFKEIYIKLHQFVGDGMSNGELESIIFMATDCSNKEIDAAICAARARGVPHLKYVKAIIEGNRRRAGQIRSLGKEVEYVPDDFSKRRVHVPRVDLIRDNWRKRLRDMAKRVKTAEAESDAERKSNIGRD